jgi:hypothetical protein
VDGPKKAPVSISSTSTQDTDLEKVIRAWPQISIELRKAVVRMIG